MATRPWRRTSWEHCSLTTLELVRPKSPQISWIGISPKSIKTRTAKSHSRNTYALIYDSFLTFLETAQSNQRKSSTKEIKKTSWSMSMSSRNWWRTPSSHWTSQSLKKWSSGTSTRSTSTNQVESHSRSISNSSRNTIDPSHYQFDLPFLSTTFTVFRKKQWNWIHTLDWISI